MFIANSLKIVLRSEERCPFTVKRLRHKAQGCRFSYAGTSH